VPLWLKALERLAKTPLSVRALAIGCDRST
jgi:hypothetical protein